MANRQRSSTLVDQTISKLVNFQGVPVQNGGPGTKAAVQVPWARGGPAKKRAIKITVGKIFVVIAWILLALNVLAVFGNADYGWERHLNLGAMEKAVGYPIKAIQVSMLVAGACALSFATWLYWKCNRGDTSTALAVIIIILLMPLVFLKAAPHINIPKRGAVVKTLSSYLPTKTAAEDKTVTGILYTEDKPSAVIGFDIVHEGDTIHGVKIVKIDKKEVHFEKSGKAWSQRLQQQLPAYW